jgi:hypothetical protein
MLSVTVSFVEPGLSSRLRSANFAGQPSGHLTPAQFLAAAPDARALAANGWKIAATTT